MPTYDFTEQGAQAKNTQSTDPWADAAKRFLRSPSYASQFLQQAERAAYDSAIPEMPTALPSPEAMYRAAMIPPPRGPGPDDGFRGATPANFNWEDYAVGGAASRDDSFTNLDPKFSGAVQDMLVAADQYFGQPGSLKVTSAYRSPELQAQLYENAIAKYGSPEAARRWVAPPGQSRHNLGVAVDFADPSGRLLRDPNSPHARWLAANAERFGLHVPMSWEPWQVELLGSR